MLYQPSSTFKLASDLNRITKVKMKYLILEKIHEQESRNKDVKMKITTKQILLCSKSSFVSRISISYLGKTT